MGGNKYTIKFTPNAYEDLDKIYNYIAKDLDESWEPSETGEKVFLSY